MVLAPLAAVAGLMMLSGWIQHARDEVMARQVMVTDAIHRELGAVVAPVVKKRMGRPWELVMTVPFERPALVGMILAAAHRALARVDRMATERTQIVLTHQRG